ncbi:hypothetical protein ACP70R_042544 [Stipagrostis hirtigluma subsp. patula]
MAPPFRLPDPNGHAYDHAEDEWFQGGSKSRSPAKPVPPPYGRRAGLVPRRQEDFGDGGAFPEVHVPQYPLAMGRGDREAAQQGSSSNVLSVTVDGRGGVAFDAVVRQGENAVKIVYSGHGDLVPKVTAPEEDSDDGDDLQEVTERTRAALQVIVDARLSAVQPTSVRPRHRSPTFVKYRPARQSAAFNSGAGERVVRVEEAQEDPVLPPKHKRRRVPSPAGSPPVTVLHSPPRPVSRKDQDEWKIPPCISSWKNPRGYSIPLDKRLATDGRGLQDAQVSDGFAGLSEALYVAEQKAREATRIRAAVRNELMLKEKLQREHELRELASKARADAARATGAGARPAAAAERDMIREERRRERQREARAATSSGKKSAGARDRDRDVSERIALGMASGVGGAGGEVTYDERLFNQEHGMDSGFAADDQYNVYSERLFAAQPTTLYRPNKHGDADMYGDDADEQLEKVSKTDRFRPDKGFSGAPERAAGKRERPAEFERPEESDDADDPFKKELDHLINQMKGKKKD